MYTNNANAIFSKNRTFDKNGKPIKIILYKYTKEINCFGTVSGKEKSGTRVSDFKKDNITSKDYIIFHVVHPLDDHDKKGVNRHVKRRTEHLGKRQNRMDSWAYRWCRFADRGTGYQGNIFYCSRCGIWRFQSGVPDSIACH